jgi:hypothetical protein
MLMIQESWDILDLQNFPKPARIGDKALPDILTWNLQVLFSLRPMKAPPSGVKLTKSADNKQLLRMTHCCREHIL